MELSHQEAAALAAVLEAVQDTPIFELLPSEYGVDNYELLKKLQEDDE